MLIQFAWDFNVILQYIFEAFLPSLLHRESTFLLFNLRSWNKLMFSISHGLLGRVIIPESRKSQGSCYSLSELFTTKNDLFLNDFVFAEMFKALNWNKIIFLYLSQFLCHATMAFIFISKWDFKMSLIFRI